MCDAEPLERPSLYEHAGGMPACMRLAATYPTLSAGSPSRVSICDAGRGREYRYPWP